MHHPTDRIAHSTAFVIPVMEHWLEWEIAQWVHHEGLIWWSIAPWADTYHTLFVLVCTCENIHWKHKQEIAYCIHQQKLIVYQLSVLSPGFTSSFTCLKPAALGVMGRLIDPSWLTHWSSSHSSQCSTTGVTKAMGYKRTLAANQKE